MLWVHIAFEKYLVSSTLLLTHYNSHTVRAHSSRHLVYVRLCMPAYVYAGDPVCLLGKMSVRKLLVKQQQATDQIRFRLFSKYISYTSQIPVETIPTKFTQNNVQIFSRTYHHKLQYKNKTRTEWSCEIHGPA